MKRRGFTLAELLVVMAILCIIVLIFIGALAVGGYFIYKSATSTEEPAKIEAKATPEKIQSEEKSE